MGYRPDWWPKAAPISPNCTDVLAMCQDLHMHNRGSFVLSDENRTAYVRALTWLVGNHTLILCPYDSQVLILVDYVLEEYSDTVANREGE